jgi:hypothetical protein
MVDCRRGEQTAGMLTVTLEAATSVAGSWHSSGCALETSTPSSLLELISPKRDGVADARGSGTVGVVYVSGVVVSFALHQRRISHALTQALVEIADTKGLRGLYSYEMMREAKSSSSHRSSPCLSCQLRPSDFFLSEDMAASVTH